MIWLCIYLWAVASIAALVALTTIRPAHSGDVVRAIFFPVLFPLFFITQLVRKS